MFPHKATSPENAVQLMSVSVWSSTDTETTCTLTLTRARLYPTHPRQVCVAVIVVAILYGSRCTEHDVYGSAETNTTFVYSNIHMSNERIVE